MKVGKSMVEKGMADLFNRIYYLIKLTFYFWLFSSIGLLVFGSVPACMALVEIHKQAQWDVSEVYFKECWNNYKRYFKPGFCLTFCFGFSVAVLLWNLFISVQISGLLFLIVDIALICLLVLCILTMFIFIGLFPEYEIRTLNAIKLSFLQIFVSPKEVGALVIGIGMIGLITYQFTGLLLFLSIGMSIIIIQNCTKKMIIKINLVF